VGKTGVRVFDSTFMFSRRSTCKRGRSSMGVHRAPPCLSGARSVLRGGFDRISRVVRDHSLSWADDAPFQESWCYCSGVLQKARHLRQLPTTLDGAWHDAL